MDEKSLGRVYFKDGHTEEILEAYHHEHPGLLSVKTESGVYVRAYYGHSDSFAYYKNYVNHDWETIYKRVHNIDHVELK